MGVVPRPVEAHHCGPAWMRWGPRPAYHSRFGVHASSTWPACAGENKKGSILKIVDPRVREADVQGCRMPGQYIEPANVYAVCVLV